MLLRPLTLLPMAFVLGAGNIGGTSPKPGDKLLTFVDPVTYEITQRITVANGDVSALDLLELNLPIPLDWPEQKVTRIKTIGDDTVRLRDVNDLGRIVRSLYRHAKVLPKPGEARSLAVTYRLTRREVRTDAAALTARTHHTTYDKQDPDYRLYTRPEMLIETDAPAIIALAANLKRGNEGPYLFARAAYDYVIDHTEYASPSPSHGAVQCLSLGKADCGSYTALFVALCRAGGVPARPIAGCWAQGENQWHCWAEFLIPDVGWIPVDPSAGDRGGKERGYYFGNLDSNRVSLAKTFNLTVDTQRGSTDLGFAQVGTWWWYPAPGSTGSQMTVRHLLLGKSTAR